MSKQAIIIFLCLFPNLLFGQNWSIINSTDKFNYRLDGDQIISATIWVDSTNVIGSDSIFYLNRIVCDTCLKCTSCYGLQNEPQFLQRKCIVLPSGVFQLKDTGNIVIKSLASLNETWLFDSLRNIYADVSIIREETVFTTSDSVKTILLSTGDTIKLSRSFGLIQYPLGYNHHSYFRLVGIEEKFGEQVLKFSDFFSINVNDMFEYHDYYYTDDGSSYTIQKYTIVSKIIKGDTITFGVSGLQKEIDRGIETFYTTINSNLTYMDSLQNLTNLFNHQSTGVIAPTIAFHDCSNVNLSIDTNNIASKSINGLAHLSTSDTLFQDTFTNRFSKVFKIGLGMTDYVYHAFEDGDEYHLVSYRKGNDTIGVFTPDYILTGTNEVLKNNDVKVYPNPASTLVTIYSDKNVYNLQVEIFNSIGVRVYSNLFNGRQKLIECNFPSGIYFIQFHDKERTWVKKLVKE